MRREQSNTRGVRIFVVLVVGVLLGLRSMTAFATEDMNQSTEGSGKDAWELDANSDSGNMEIDADSDLGNWQPEMDSDYDGWQPEMDSDYDGWQLETDLYTDQEIIEYVRNGLKARETKISFRPVNTYNEEFSEFTRWVLDRVFEHNYGGPGDEGDYLKAMCQIGTRSRGGDTYSFGSIQYYTTAIQELKLTQHLSEAYLSLGLNKLSDYKKVVKIHDYLIKDCDYVNSSAYYASTAYGTILYKNATSLGYAQAFYRMCMDNGVDCRIINGYVNGVSKTWNIVRIGASYYNVDVALDSSFSSKDWFLKSDNDFNKEYVHKMYGDDATEDFLKQYPIASASLNSDPGSIALASLHLSVNGISSLQGAYRGYGEQTGNKIIIQNAGTAATGELTVSLSGANASSFKLSQTKISSIAAGKTGYFTVKPKTGLALGKYCAVVTVKSSIADVKPVSFTVDFNLTDLCKLTVSVAEIDFGNIQKDRATYPSKTITIRNIGTTDTKQLWMSYSSNAKFDYNFNGSSLAPGESMSFTISPRKGQEIAAYTSEIDIFCDNYRFNSIIIPVKYQIIDNNSISLSNSGTKTLQTAKVGYKSPVTLSTTIKATGNSSSGALKIALSGTNKDSFILSKTAISSLGSKQTTSFTVKPKTGLAKGTYTATVTVSGALIESKSFKISFTVKDAYAISLSNTGTKTISTLMEGYSSPAAIKTTISNIGFEATEQLNLTLSGTNPGSFRLSSKTINSIASGKTNTFNVTPVKGLTPGTYTATVTVSNQSVGKKSFNVSFTVSPHTHKWSTEYSSDASSHWYRCLNTGCKITVKSKMKGYGAHVDKDKNNVCDVCGRDLLLEKKSALVERMYQNTLGRSADLSGRNYWMDGLKKGTLSGADLAKCFILSDEFIARNLSDDAFLKVMYKAFFNREPDTNGYEFWKGLLSQGVSRKRVLSQFINAPEYKNLCGSCGIQVGSYVSDEYRDKNEKLTAFVSRCYTEALGRPFDANGLNYWTEMVINGKCSAKDVAVNFIGSSEFQARKLSNQKYIETLYTTFFNRKCSETELQYWVGVLKSGSGNRNSVLQFFANSDEFRTLMSSYGVK